jgi:ABC-type nitrate/sulfonate/bicarbonate transport system ATPase subunit
MPHVVLRQLAPYLAAAARSGLSLVWKIVLIVELLGRPNGVGFEIGVAFQLFDVTRILAKCYRLASGGSLHVLGELAFGLKSGEVAALVGPSGCGKTTLLRIIAGLDRDFRGRVVFPTGGRLGMVFQEPRLLAWHTVEQNVRLAAPHASNAELAALFEMLELTVHRNLYPGELSLGLARRVALARAFAINQSPFT